MGGFVAEESVGVVFNRSYNEIDVVVADVHPCHVGIVIVVGEQRFCPEF